MPKYDYDDDDDARIMVTTIHKNGREHLVREASLGNGEARHRLESMLFFLFQSEKKRQPCFRCKKDCEEDPETIVVAEVRGFGDPVGAANIAAAYCEPCAMAAGQSDDIHCEFVLQFTKDIVSIINSAVDIRYGAPEYLEKRT